MKIAFCTHCNDKIYESIGCDKLVRSAKYFHPKIPFLVYGDKEINRIFKENPWCDFYTIHPVVAQEVKKKYDLVVHFDADSVIVDPLDEILKADYEVAGVRNNPDFSYEINEHLLQFGINWLQYINAGCVASTSDKFYDLWVDVNKSKYVHYFPYKEQDILNIIAYSDKFNFKLLDPIDKPLYYGVSNVYSTFTKPLPESCKTYRNLNFWESWQDIKVKKSGLYLNNKKVKILHQAGGFNEKKLQPDIFNKETWKFIESIIR